ncbi:uncharacterized protein LOC142327996 isoform X2 [Lycorma delicatula]|uniref:uncharacterized protein LOC142327996 isoform X2 n=1 Tax=Lycorma delicatula TaxID=130591 RepID=UPI003F5111F0
MQRWTGEKRGFVATAYYHNGAMQCLKNEKRIMLLRLITVYDKSIEYGEQVLRLLKQTRTQTLNLTAYNFFNINMATLPSRMISARLERGIITWSQI